MPFSYTFADIADRPVAVFGAGTLGRRIAMMLASRGGTVNIYSRSAETANDAVRYVHDTLPGVVEERGYGTIGTVTACSDVESTLDNAWLAIESVPERLDVKHSMWAQIDAAAGPDTIFTTNSSSYPSRLMADSVSDPTRLCNLHFYMPPTANAADIMSDGVTDPAVLDTLRTVLPEFGIHPFEARRECTGFIFNRIWAAIKRESLAVVAEGVADPADVDAMFRLNMGAGVGPFALMDAVGLDVVLDIEEHYAQEFPHLPIGPRTLLRQYVDAGKLGAKTGEGFYDHPSNAN
ncbi:3-hydroxyacyl-CoA dehydrogenase family protein [Gordonia sp. TBRC 11910]|uniref:3-hydroxyacyl-CoA dehydrogenase family protein n=1 Tax=Gordonia asplenii TaxID=2725283 RepID=A0A848KM44_9ACTN|nr:3-hydroxyacyl-CoA dehydrogenase family protein [Gordonia asplenii]NMN99735.1 3-hydroxyacyl-CoA dehydrogenase family protein [Gordonia asplenii]